MAADRSHSYDQLWRCRKIWNCLSPGRERLAAYASESNPQIRRVPNAPDLTSEIIFVAMVLCKVEKLDAQITEYCAIGRVLVEQMKNAVVMHQAIGIIHPSSWRAVMQLRPVLFIVQHFRRTQQHQRCGNKYPNGKHFSTHSKNLTQSQNYFQTKVFQRLHAVTDGIEVKLQIAFIQRKLK